MAQAMVGICAIASNRGEFMARVGVVCGLIFSMGVAARSIAQDNLTFSVNREVLNGNQVEFIEHVGDGRWKNYLAMNLPFPPLAFLFADLIIHEGHKMTSRGEAHITVITPVEFQDVLGPRGVTMAEINEIAREMDIQNSSFTIDCLERRSKVLRGKPEHTYYLVVSSTELEAIRRRVQRVFVAKGGEASAFPVSKDYYPHITVGYTDRDLHASDGILKDGSHCMADVVLTD